MSFYLNSVDIFYKSWSFPYFQVIAEHLSIEEVEVIREMFKLMDTDNNGKVTFEELKAGLQKVGSQLAEPEMKMLMDAVRFWFV